MTETTPAGQVGPGSSVRDIDVYVIGDVNPDILVIDDDVVPEFGQIEKLVGTIRLTVGGSSAITACGLARLGLRVAHGGVVGDDLLGHAIVEALRVRNVETSSISVDPAIPTGATVILGKGDHRALLTATGTIDRLRAEDVPRELLPRVRHIHAGSTAIQPRLRQGLPELFREARAAGVTSSFDTNWDPDRRWQGIDGLLASADVFFPNEREAGAHLGRGGSARGGARARGEGRGGRARPGWRVRSSWPSSWERTARSWSEVRRPCGCRPGRSRSWTRRAPVTPSMPASSAPTWMVGPSRRCSPWPSPAGRSPRGPWAG